MESCIYEGQVRHTRQQPVAHRFRYPMLMMYLDLSELDTVFQKHWFWSAKRMALARFRRSDHVGASHQPLDHSIRDLVHCETGVRPAGPIRLLTNLSYFGCCFNPVSYYYCFDESGTQLNTIVAEVTNTPWREQDTYVMPVSRGERRGKILLFREQKKMHVSPFMPMDMEYDFCFSLPGENLSVFMANLHDGRRVFDASIRFKRTAMDGRSLARVLIRYPFMSLKILLAIHWEALKLWIKGCPVYPHPRKRAKIATASQ